MARHRATYKDAKPGELWLLIDWHGKERPHVRTSYGWRSFGRRNRMFVHTDFQSGAHLWSPPPAPDLNEGTPT